MELPPGPRYLWNLAPSFALPSLLLYLTFTFLRLAGIYELSQWITIPLIVLARPILFITGGYYKEWRNIRDAAAMGGILPPQVKEWSVLTIKDMVNKIQLESPAETMSEFMVKYGGTYRLTMLNESIYNTSEPDHVKAILATQFDSFEKGPVFFDQMNSLLGTGVFNTDGDMWKFHRAMTRPFFTRERISDFEIYHRNCDAALQIAKKRLEEGFAIDVQDLVSRFALDSATEFLIGKNVGSLSAGIPYPPTHKSMNPPSFYNHPSTPFMEALNEGQIASMPRIEFGADWPLWEFWKDKVKPKRRVVNNFTEPIVDLALENRRKEIAAGTESKGEEESLLAHLVKHTQDETVLNDELINLLVAGKDTTGCLLTFCVYMLSQHPEVEKRLRQEIFDKVGTERTPTYDQMREMKYMRAFLNEVLRLYPPVPINGRQSTKAIVLPRRDGQSPIYVPAGTGVIYVVWIMHRRTDLWGSDAHTFDPDRFLDERLTKYLLPNPFIFSPFNAGPRICLGQQFAYHEATFFLVRLLQNFSAFTLDDTLNVPPAEKWAKCNDRRAAEKVFPKAHLTTYVKGGLWVRMKELRT